MSEPPREIIFEVSGWPPIKNEAKSLLSAAHPQAARVHALLTAAQAAVRRTGWKPGSEQVALELIIRSPGRPPGDATNFLGGLGDVLQGKLTKPGLDLAHLGELRTVALFGDDRQISQISYHEEPAKSPSYLVRISNLS
jgi:hypothetical protein